MKRGGDTLRKKDSRKEAEKETCSFKETSSETVCSREIREKDAGRYPYDHLGNRSNSNG